MSYVRNINYIQNKDMLYKRNKRKRRNEKSSERNGTLDTAEISMKLRNAVNTINSSRTIFA